MAGEIVEEITIRNDRVALRKLSEKYPEARVAMEVGSDSPYISRILEKWEREVFVSNARKLRPIYESDRKSE